MAVLNELNQAQLVEILLEPKNALTKQYNRLFEMESCGLEFREEALKQSRKKLLRERQELEGCVPFWKNLC